MNGAITLKRQFQMNRQSHGRKVMSEDVPAERPTGRIPRVSRVMALAMQCEQLIRNGVIKNQSELAHYAQVTTARMTHIMWLVNLAPNIQETILFLPRVESGSDPITEIEVRRIVRVMDWSVQQSRWGNKLADLSP